MNAELNAEQEKSKNLFLLHNFVFPGLIMNDLSVHYSKGKMFIICD